MDQASEILSAKREESYYRRYEGRTIGEIHIFRNNAFEGGHLVFERLLNATHVVTREKEIRKDLFFKEGGTFKADLMTRNKQLIQTRRYIADVQILAVPQAADTNVVDIYVVTRDTWSIGLLIDAKDGGQSRTDLFDDNLMGFGNSLRVGTYLDWKTFKYGGNIVEYSMPNAWGSFFSTSLVAGKGFDYVNLGGETIRDFILPMDNAGGGAVLYTQEPIVLFPSDSIFVAASRYYDLWWGRSFYNKRTKNSFYFTIRAFHRDFAKRPPVTDKYNPFFHNHTMALFNTGLYREDFRRANLIFGFGIEEYIPYGFRFGVTGGYVWGEFAQQAYVGGELNAGHFLSFGYLQWSVELGSYINRRNGTLNRSALKSHITYFSNLLGGPRYRLRQFVNLYLIRGWNRLDGYRELSSFRYNGELRGLKDDNIGGLNTLTLNSETVLFTPWNIVDFRFALFGYLDTGLIGNQVNLFRNEFYTTVGMGVRIKNEKLIFRTLTIRFGLALNKRGFAPNYPISISGEDRLNPIRYRPVKAAPIVYE